MTTVPDALAHPDLPLVLGGNTFGWTADEAQSHAVLDAFVDAGGTLVDTADVYSAWAPGNSGGESESVIGSWLARRGRPDGLVLATKVSQHPQHRGLSASNVAAAADASLRRLGVDHIDLYYAHFDEEGRDIREIAQAFDALVRAGKVGAVGVSNLSPERIRAWTDAARAEGWAEPVALQPEYNLVARARYESAYRPLADDLGLAVLPYSSLASGFLTGKYRTADDAQGAARGGQAAEYLTPDGLRVLDALTAVADAHGITPGGAALAWLVGRGVTAPIASARTTEQLPSLVEGVRTTLTDDELRSLDDASRAFA